MNDKRGGKVCDGCGERVQDEGRTILFFVAVLLERPADHPAECSTPAMHFCRRACLGKVVEATVATLEAGDGEKLEISPRDFEKIVRYAERWRASEEGPLPHHDVAPSRARFLAS